MLEPIGGLPAPSHTDIQAMWQEVHFDPIPWDSPHIEALLHALRATHVNGGALLGCFRLPDHPVFLWYASRGRYRRYERYDGRLDFFSHFLTSSAVNTTMSQLKTDGGLAATAEFDERTSAFTLDGELAEVLAYGGAYERFRGTPREAKELAGRACNAIFGERYLEVDVFRSYEPWSEWFYQVAWDVSWVLVDRRAMIAWLLCLTDTD